MPPGGYSPEYGVQVCAVLKTPFYTSFSAVSVPQDPNFTFFFLDIFSLVLEYCSKYLKLDKIKNSSLKTPKFDGSQFSKPLFLTPIILHLAFLPNVYETNNFLPHIITIVDSSHR